jgi:hypothetical protein
VKIFHDASSRAGAFTTLDRDDEAAIGPIFRRFKPARATSEKCTGF